MLARSNPDFPWVAGAVVLFAIAIVLRMIRAHSKQAQKGAAERQRSSLFSELYEIRATLAANAAEALDIQARLARDNSHERQQVLDFESRAELGKRFDTLKAEGLDLANRQVVIQLRLEKLHDGASQ